MKKIVAFLLCLVVVLSLLSCQNPHGPIEPENEYSDIINLYRLAVDACLNHDGGSSYEEKYGIIDTPEKELFCDMLRRAYSYYTDRDTADSLSPIYKLTFGYAKKDLNGDDVDELVLLNEDYTVFGIFSYSDGKPVLIGGLDYAFPDKRSSLENGWIDGDGFIYEYSEGIFEHKIKYKVAQGGASLETVAEYRFEEVAEYQNGQRVENVTKYYMYDGDEEVEITESEYRALDDQHGAYLGQYSGNEVTKEYSGLEFIPLFSEAELIKDIYESVLNTKTKVYEAETGEYKFLKDFRTPYEKKLLADVTDLKYGFVDLDGDGVGEVVLDCGDKIILRYYNRKVYLYSFTFRQMTDVNTDGSFNWTFTGENHEYGSKKIYFEGEKLKTKELWRIVNDGETNAEYYIDGKQVSNGEILEYLDANSRGNIEYLSMDESWNYRLSVEEARETARKYLRVRNEPEGALGTTIYPKFVVAATPNEDDVYYHILYIGEYYNHREEGWETRPPYSLHINYEVLVNATTGECFKTEIQKRCMAIKNAKEYLGVMNWEYEISEGIKTVPKLEIAEFAHCENPYYRVVLIREYYVYSEDSSENVSPFKVETLKEVFVEMNTGECMESISDDKG